MSSLWRPLVAVVIGVLLLTVQSDALASEAPPRQNAPVVPAAQTTITLLAQEDAGVESPLPDHGFGTDPAMRAYYQGVNELGRVLLRFSLVGQIPADAVIDSAYLRLYMTDSYNTAPVAFTASNLAAAWSEARVTWNNQPTTTSPSVIDQMIDGVVPGYKTIDVLWIVKAGRAAPTTACS